MPIAVDTDSRVLNAGPSATSGADHARHDLCVRRDGQRCGCALQSSNRLTAMCNIGVSATADRHTRKTRLQRQYFCTFWFWIVQTNAFRPCMYAGQSTAFGGTLGGRRQSTAGVMQSVFAPSQLAATAEDRVAVCAAPSLRVSINDHPRTRCQQSLWHVCASSHRGTLQCNVTRLPANATVPDVSAGKCHLKEIGSDEQPIVAGPAVAT